MGKTLDRFFFGIIEARRVAVLRILFGVLALREFMVNFSIAEFHFANTGWLQLGKLPWSSQPAEIWGEFFDGWSISSTRILFILGAFLALLMIVGLFSRLSVVLVFLTLLVGQSRNHLILAGGDCIVLNVLFILMFSECGKTWSIDRYRLRETNSVFTCSGWPLRMIQMFICLVYMITGAAKLLGHDWLNGSALNYVMINPRVSRWTTTRLGVEPWHSVAAWISIFVPLWEVSFPFLLIWRPVRGWNLLLGTIFHLLTAIFMKVFFFGQIMILSYAAFVPDKWLASLERRILGYTRVVNGWALLATCRSVQTCRRDRSVTTE